MYPLTSRQFIYYSTIEYFSRIFVFGYNILFGIFLSFWELLCVSSLLDEKKLGLRDLPSSPQSSPSSSSSVSVDLDLPRFFSFFRFAAARRRAKIQKWFKLFNYTTDDFPKWNFPIQENSWRKAWKLYKISFVVMFRTLTLTRFHCKRNSCKWSQVLSYKSMNQSFRKYFQDISTNFPSTKHNSRNQLINAPFSFL